MDLIQQQNDRHPLPRTALLMGLVITIAFASFTAGLTIGQNTAYKHLMPKKYDDSSTTLGRFGKAQQYEEPNSVLAH